MKRTCLLITERLEPTADLLIAELRRRDVPCVRWNLDQFPLGSTLTYRASNSSFTAEISTDGRRVNLDTIASIWCRRFRPSGLPTNLGATDRKFAETEARRALDALMTITKVVWINHPQRQALANSKPAQLFMARQVGLEIPLTVITNNPEEANEFAAASGRVTIYKTMSQTLVLEPGKALFTGVLARKELANLELIRVSPGIFQELVPKSYEVRATVVGRQIFSGKISSQASEETEIDWRHGPFDIEDRPIQLPHDVEAGIHAVMEGFGLVYGAFDFIVTPEGRHIFLEVNPAGHYMWVETKTGLPITSAIADALSRPCLE